MVRNIKSSLLRFAIATSLAILLVLMSVGAKAFDSSGYDFSCAIQGHIHVPKNGATEMMFARVDSCSAVKSKVESNALILSSKTESVMAVFPHRLPQGRYTFVYAWGAKTAWVNDMVLSLKVIPIPLAQ